MRVAARIKKLLSLALFVVCGAAAQPAFAAIPETIHYHGYLTDTSGMPQTGTLTVHFSLYASESGGEPLWSETHDGVPVEEGRLSVALGSFEALTSDLFTDTLYLGIAVDSDAEMTPRLSLASVPYAHRAAIATSVADGAVTAATIADGSITAAKFAPNGCSAGELMKWDGTAWGCAADTDTTYSAGAGLSLSGTQLRVDTAAIQNRVGGSCAAGSSIRVINADGTVSCEYHPDTTYTAGSGLLLSGSTFSIDFAGTGSASSAARSDHNHDGSYWRLGGSSGTTPGTHYLGTSDNQALEFKVNGTRVLRLEPGLSGEHNLIGGHSANSVTSGVRGATIGGGGRDIYANIITDYFGTIGGGYGNQAGDGAGTLYDGDSATVGGGIQNTASGRFATIGGGGNNTASGDNATVGGGWYNTASGMQATVAGGGDNTASGSIATIPGGSHNTAAGIYSFAAGHRAKANHNGAFVWGDFSYSDVSSAANNQFTVRASGGVRFFSDVDLSTGVTLNAGSGSWTTLSDRNQKENFRAEEGEAVLAKVAALPITSWNYKAEGAEVRHLGPMAQDFHAAFGLGADDRTITTVDVDGVNMLAIQALEKRTRDLQARLDGNEERLAALAAENAALKAERASWGERLVRLEEALVLRSAAAILPPAVGLGGATEQ